MGGTKPGKKPNKKGKSPKKTITRGRVRIGKTFYTYTIYGDAPWGFIICHGKRVTFKINRKTNKAVIKIGKTGVNFTVPNRLKKSTKKPNKKGKKPKKGTKPGKKGKKPKKGTKPGK